MEIGDWAGERTQICVDDVYVDQGATASDNFDDDDELTASIMVSGLPLDTSMTGVFTILYEVVDTAGNVAEPKSRVVQVIDDPSICAEMSKCARLSCCCIAPTRSILV